MNRHFLVRSFVWVMIVACWTFSAGPGFGSEADDAAPGEPQNVPEGITAESGPSPTPQSKVPEEATPTPTPTPISEEEFQNRVSQWTFMDFIQIGPIKEATLNNLSTGEAWRVEEGDVVGDLQVISMSGEGLRVKIGGREGDLLPVERTGSFPILEDGFANYTWNPEEGAPKMVGDRVFRGGVSFLSTGNNRLNIPPEMNLPIGDDPGAYSRINVAIMLLNANADILIQVRGEKKWWSRWGFDGQKKYQSGYSWAPKGTTTELQPNRWHYFSIHLVDDLGFPEGDRVMELAFSAHGKDVMFDTVSLTRHIPSGARAVQSNR